MQTVIGSSYSLILVAVMWEIVSRALPPGARAYLDVMVHNAPSIRAVEKAGFRRIGTRKPLSRKRAYA